MDAIRRAISFVTGRNADSGKGDLELPNAVERAYVLAKDVGHRGPVVGGFQFFTSDNTNVILTVTPSALAMVAADSAAVLCQVSPEEGDAFTCALLCEKGLLVGCQSGKTMLAKISAKNQVEVNKTVCSFASPVTCLTSSIAIGSEAGILSIWDPDTDHTVSLSVATSGAITACLTIDSELWVALDKEGLRVLPTKIGGGEIQIEVTKSSKVQLEGMETVTDMVYAANHSLVICLSSCSDVFMIDRSTRECLHRYPATLMTLGASLSSIVTLDREDFPESTFLILGGVDGSLCIRELNRRKLDGKLQCVLLRCFDRLSPRQKGDTQEPIDPSEGVPITWLFVTSEKTSCIVGDASCALFVVNLESYLRTAEKREQVANV